MGDAGEGLVDAESRLAERMEEREQEKRKARQGGNSGDPERFRQVESNRLAKTLVDAAHDVALDAALSMSTVSQQKIFAGDDLHEGVAAFFAKRDPVFSGR